MKHIRTAAVMLLALTLLTGVVYPLAVTGVAQLLFPAQANGSLVVVNGNPVGSSLIGQPFADAKHFWSRGSATSPVAYNAASSSGSNLGPINPALFEAVTGRVDALAAADPEHRKPIPVDLVTTSASGLDPDVSPAAALYQVPRIALARGLDPAALRRLVAEHTHARQLGILGEPRVNVLQLNLALDALSP